MNRIDRLIAIILMLQSSRVVTAEKIAAHFEISVRTVYRDIAALGEAGVPIMAEAGVGYSLMRGYHMPPVMFTEAETAALFMSGELAKKFGDESLKKGLDGALLKVRAVLPEGQKSYLNRLGRSVEVWNRPTGLHEEKSLIPIQDAVVRKRCVALRYNAGGRGEITERVVDPLGLAFYGRQWHLIAWCRLRDSVRDFRLDRMRSWQVLDETFFGHGDFSLAAYFSEREDELPLIPVQIECERWVAEHMLQEIPCRVESKQELPDGRFLVEAQACSLEWVACWLVGMANAAVARGPAELRSLVLEKARKIVHSHT